MQRIPNVYHPSLARSTLASVRHSATRSHKRCFLRFYGRERIRLFFHSFFKYRRSSNMTGHPILHKQPVHRRLSEPDFKSSILTFLIPYASRVERRTISAQITRPKRCLPIDFNVTCRRTSGYNAYSGCQFRDVKYNGRSAC